MRSFLLSALLCTLCLFASATASAADTAPLQPREAARQAKGAPHLPQSADVGLWLSQQLHRPVEASQILLAPEAAALEGCAIARARLASTGATALSLHCPAPTLPHLVLLDLSPISSGGPHPSTGRPYSPPGGSYSPSFGECGEQRKGGPYPPGARSRSGVDCGVPGCEAVGECGNQPPAPKIVRAGAALRADWRTEFIHAQLPVVALDSGAVGAEIRVRIPQTNRIVRARILSANAVAIIAAGA